MPDDTEILDRVRRIESRVVALTHKLGFASRTKKPVLLADRLEIQSMGTCFDEVLAAIGDSTQEVPVVFGGEIKAFIRKELAS